MVQKANENNASNLQQTTINTKSVAPGANKPQSKVLNKETVVQNVNEKPIVEKVVEKKDVEVHHKPVIQEVHEQKIYEIQKQPMVHMVQKPAVVEQQKARPIYQEVGTIELSEAERLRLEKLKLESAPKVISQPGTFQEIKEKETVAQVINQQHVERHVQPVITEVREQKVVKDVVHPIVRKIHEPPIVREVPYINEDLKYTMDTGRFNHFETKFQPRSEADIHNQCDMIETISCAGKEHMWGLSHDHELYHLTFTGEIWEWQFYPIQGMKFRDLSVTKGGVLFAIGLHDGLLYRLSMNSNKMELVLPGDNMRLLDVSVASKRKIYAITEDGSVLFLSIPLFGSNYKWTKMGQGMKKISVGGKHLLRGTEIWCIGTNGRAFRYYKENWIEFPWEVLDISVTIDNAVYFVGKDGKLYKWDGAENWVRQSRGFEGEELGRENASSDLVLTNVTAYKEGKQVYAIEKGTGNLWKMVV